ncbi:MAG: family transporter protein [Bacilli bacterium]|nr:family transporter protein [Bacilli bacterium]
MNNLLLNENMKIYRRLRTWILILVLIVTTATVLVFVHNDLAKGNWKTNIQHEIDNDNRRLLRTDITSDRKLEAENNLKVNQYHLDHNLPPVELSLWGGVLTAANLIIVVTIFTVIIAAESVAGEFSSGTIKLLLIGPASRSKILFSKYVTMLAFFFLLLIALFSTAFLASGILEGFNNVGIPYIYATHDGTLHVVNMVGYVLSTYGYDCIQMILMVTMAFMISTVFRSSSVAIGLSIGLSFIGTAIANFLSQHNYSWAKYFLFENTDLTQYLNGSPMLEGMTLQFSIGVLVVYFLIFNALSWIVFNKRDVTA